MLRRDLVRHCAALVAVLLLVIGCAVGAAGATEQGYVFSRLAGPASDHNYGSGDGFGEAARFQFPRGVAMDGSGNIYIADTGNSTIRRISPEGLVSTFAGAAGKYGSTDGVGGEARFNGPESLAVDQHGNLYVADDGNHTIRKISPSGSVTTLAGKAGYSGAEVGKGPEARFMDPYALAVDLSGNVYVGQAGDAAIRKIAPDGTVTIYAGNPSKPGSVDGDRGSALLGECGGLAVDGAGNLYVAEIYKHTVRRIGADGRVTTLAGVSGQAGFADGVGAMARFSQPRQLALDEMGNLYVADELNSVVRKVTPSGVVSTFAGKPGQRGRADGPDNATFSGARGIARGLRGEFYVADSGNSSIRKISPAGVVTTVAGGVGGAGYADGSSERAQFYFPMGVAVDGRHNVFVADATNYVIRKITAGGAVSTVAGRAGSFGSADGPGATARFGVPAGIAVDEAGNLYVANLRGHRIAKIAPDGMVSTLAGTSGLPGSTDGDGRTEARFNGPVGVAVNRAGVVYVADYDNHTIRRISPEGQVTTLAGAAGQPGKADGTGAAARFYAPAGVAVDQNGMIYVADSWMGSVRKVTPEGVVTTLMGPAYGDGRSETLFSPFGIAVSPDGEVLVSDTGHSLIRKLARDGTVITLGGSPGQDGNVDGSGNESRLFNPYGIAVDATGNLYVADSNNNVIRKAVLQSATKPAFRMQPENQVTLPGQPVTLAMATSQSPASTLQWYRNGTAITGATSASLTMDPLTLPEVGLFAAVAANGAEILMSKVAIVAVVPVNKVTGSGVELLPADIRHSNGNIFDQVLLTGAAEAITADCDPDPKKNQITRTSFVDLDDDIVQVEFSGPGTLSLVLENATGPALPVNYNQATTYVKGHAGIVIAGATEQTNVSVFSVGKATAVNQALFKDGVKYDGIADIAFIAILSSNGKFGGVRTANANYFAMKGLTGLYAPGVAFTGPVFIGDITAFETATPVIQVGSVSEARITGGDLAQANGAAVQVSGLAQLKFTAGSDSHGNSLPAQANKAVLKQDGVDVTAQIVADP